jgi:nicotinate-nucleotide adenylyltransferase
VIRALLGGSFDPVHEGHLALVARILDGGLATRVTVAPALLSPHKETVHAAAAERLAMLRLAFAGDDRVEVDPRELDRPGPSYTVDTLRELVAEHPADTWRLVLGADNLAGFLTWREPAAILELATLLVFTRVGAATDLPDGVPAASVELVDDFDAPVSSRVIRAMLATGRDPVPGLPATVLAHIRDHGLYDS